MEEALSWLGCLRSSGACVEQGGGPLWVLAALLVCAALALAARSAARRWVSLRASALAPALARRLARWAGPLEYSADEFARADGARPALGARRSQALERLAQELASRSPRSAHWGAQLRERFSDLRFTDASRVPFPFRGLMNSRFNLCSVVTASRGPWLLDMDGNWSLDVSGAYGVNVAGFERYKEWQERGLARVAEVGPVLGPLHPLVAENTASLAAISGLDEVSFHMSGTEAVMAAVRLARHNTRRRHIVCFAGAYHGWWDGVQPGLGSERELGDCFSLRDMDPASLTAIRWRAREIAAVLVNPLQCFHPNAPPPSDAALVSSELRQAQGDREHYTAWLRELREVCTAHDVPLIFDEVYSGFRFAPGGAQEYFGVRADMVVYGKSVAGGMPIGVVCGKRELMQRFDPRRPLRIAYVVGTFSAHPAVMGAMREFLDWVVKPQTRELYRAAQERAAAWVQSINATLEREALPLRIAELGSVWTVLFRQPGRYGWLLQYYLRAAGLNLSWVGTGRCLLSLDFEAEHYGELESRILGAARRMQADGWWVGATEQGEPARARQLRWQLVREGLASVIGGPLAGARAAARAFYDEVMARKADDHHASHHNVVNRVFHFVSSSAFVLCYWMAFSDLNRAMLIGLPALFLRQLGHAVFEPPAREKELALLGFNTPSKTLILASYALIPLAHLASAGSLGWSALSAVAPGIAWHWFLLTLTVVFGRVALLCWRHGLWSSAVWFVKLLTDPFSDLVTYAPHRLSRA